MIEPKEFYEKLLDSGINFFTGIPDSTFKPFCNYLTEKVSSKNHIISENEGGAIALATGHFLANNSPALVYLQNSGLGNAINPLTSLVDKEVYKIPMFLMIGWRGNPERSKDAYQHRKMGRITPGILDELEIPYKVLPEDQDKAFNVLDELLNIMEETEQPVAVLVNKSSFNTLDLKSVESENENLMLREDALEILLNNLSEKDVLVSTTGHTSREIFELRDKLNQKHDSDFLMVGSMGHVSQIALGISQSKPDRNIFCIDGDGSAIMHMGTFAVIGGMEPDNFKHILINNSSYDSVGGQPTPALSNINFNQIAKSCGYKKCFYVDNKKDLKGILNSFKDGKGPNLLEIKVRKGYRDNLGRPTLTPMESRDLFIKFLKDE